MGLKSNALIGMASQHMKDYRFSQDEAIEVGMTPEDTGVIILIILYFIEQEPTICRSKLEYYILLLDRKCFGAKNVLLFNWDLRNGRIRNFKKFIEFMIRKMLISFQGNHSFSLTQEGAKLSNRFAELCNINPWLKEIMHDYKDKTAKQTESEVIVRNLNKKYLDALQNTRQAMKEQQLLASN